MLYKIASDEPDGLVLCCSSPSFLAPTLEFVKNELHLENPALIAVPGCTSHFGVRASLPKRWNALRGFMRTLVAGYPRMSKLAIINHEGCKGYREIDHLLDRRALAFHQSSHAKDLFNLVQREFWPAATVALYYAKREGQDQIKFERIEQ